MTKDAYMLRSASATMRDLAAKSSMTRSGKLHFYSAAPQRVSSANYAGMCQGASVAGHSHSCYNPVSNKIYIRDMPAEIDSAEVSAAAQGMLHAAYAGLDGDERRQVDVMTAAFYAKNSDPALAERFKQFDQSNREVLASELHAVLATEAGKLPPGLENYYARYFTDRKLLIASYDKVKAVFADKKAQLEKLDESLTLQEKQLNELYDQYLSTSRYGGGTSQYWWQYEDAYYKFHADVDEYNKMLSNYNALRSAVNGSITGEYAGAYR